MTGLQDKRRGGEKRRARAAAGDYTPCILLILFDMAIGTLIAVAGTLSIEGVRLFVLYSLPFRYLFAALAIQRPLFQRILRSWRRALARRRMAKGYASKKQWREVPVWTEHVSTATIVILAVWFQWQYIAAGWAFLWLAVRIVRYLAQRRPRRPRARRSAAVSSSAAPSPSKPLAQNGSAARSNGFHQKRPSRVPPRTPPPSPEQPRTQYWWDLEEGMTQDEVKQLLGNPGHIEARPGSSTWFYSDGSGVSVTFDAERTVERWNLSVSSSD